MKLDELLRVIDIGENIQIEEKNDYKENEKIYYGCVGDLPFSCYKKYSHFDVVRVSVEEKVNTIKIIIGLLTSFGI